MIPRRDSHPAPATPHAPRGYPLTTAGLRTATFSDGMHMYTERLQILVTPEERRKLESEAEHRGESVGSLVRKAVDAAYDPVDRDGRRRALGELRAIGERNRGIVLSPDELEALIEDARTVELLDGTT